MEREAHQHARQPGVDTWAFNPHDLAEHMSMEHTRVMLGRLNPRKGDALFSNRRRPLLTMTDDTSPGVHDTLRAACDPVRYTLLGLEKHASCAENLVNALGELGLKRPTPRARSTCSRTVRSRRSDPGRGPSSRESRDYVVLRADIDAVVVFSTCPMDVFPTNGPDCTPKPPPIK